MLKAQRFDKYAEFGEYHWKMTYLGGWRRSSPLAHARYDLALSQLSKELSIASSLGLDIGCGDGVMLYKITLRGGQAIGMDSDYYGLRFANQICARLTGRNPALLQASCYEIPIPDESIDYIVAIELIEHLNDPKIFLNEIVRVLSPRGVLCLTTPNRGDLLSPRDPYHFQEYTPGDLQDLLAPFFADVKILGQYPLFLNRMYRKATGMRLIDKSLTFGFKFISSLGFNPFVHVVTSCPGNRWDGLVAICKK